VLVTVAEQNFANVPEFWKEGGREAECEYIETDEECNS